VQAPQWPDGEQPSLGEVMSSSSRKAARRWGWSDRTDSGLPFTVKLVASVGVSVIWFPFSLRHCIQRPGPEAVAERSPPSQLRMGFGHLSGRGSGLFELEGVGQGELMLATISPELAHDHHKNHDPAQRHGD